MRIRLRFNFGICALWHRHLFDSAPVDSRDQTAWQGAQHIAPWVLTGCHRQEIAELKWNEVDFDRGLLVLADNKAGRSVRPLATAVVSLLQSIEPTEGSDYVIPAGRGEGHLQGTKSVWPKIEKKNIDRVGRRLAEALLGATLCHRISIFRFA